MFSITWLKIVLPLIMDYIRETFLPSKGKVKKTRPVERLVVIVTCLFLFLALFAIDKSVTLKSENVILLQKLEDAKAFRETLEKSGIKGLCESEVKTLPQKLINTYRPATEPATVVDSSDAKPVVEREVIVTIPPKKPKVVKYDVIEELLSREWGD